MPDLRDVFQAVLAALSAEDRVVRELASAGAELLAVPRVSVVALGKPALAMARGAKRVLRERCHGLIVGSAEGQAPEGFELLIGDHPLPGPRSFEAGQRVLDFVEAIPADGAALFLIGGGASALVELPIEGVELATLRELNEALILGGAPVAELNAVRKHLSRIKGGRLGAACKAAIRTALIVSDVVGDALDAVGSGPTVADPTSVADAEAILFGNGLVPPSMEETPKPGDPRLATLENTLLVGVGTLAETAALEVERAGDRAVRFRLIEGELGAVAEALTRAARTLKAGEILVTAGEVTLSASGPGRGGRAQHLALSLARALSGERFEILVAGSDGHDFTTGAAGARVDGESWGRALARGLEPEAMLARFDSATLAAALDAQLPAFESDTHLGDLVLIRRVGESE